MTAFMRGVSERHGVELDGYDALWRWSVEKPDEFWAAVWDDCGVVAQRRFDEVIDDPLRLPGAVWFRGAELNFAENLLRRSDAGDALVFRSEDGSERRLGYAELHRLVARLARGLRSAGAERGDRVVGLLPNLPETVAAMLAAASMGAVWSSCSPDFGIEGVVDRFGQIEPTVLFSADGHRYAGRTFDGLAAGAELRRRLPSVRTHVVVPYLAERPDLSALPGAVALEAFLGPDDAGPVEFVPLPFDHPLYVLYSSGTTGVPKCIVHGAGGTLLQHLKELVLHTDLGPDDRIFYFTTCGWMMWNWLVSALATGATVVLYDGAPFHPEPGALIELVERERVTVFGTSARWLAAAEKAGVRARGPLPALRTVLSTGSPLAAEGFEYVYRDLKRDVCLSSISGGTDIISCFFPGNPIGPVFAGELQCRGLGVRAEAWSPDGRPLVGEKGELVCTQALPSMPIGFWGDPDGARYRAAYFERFPGVWHHGDFAEITPRGGAVIYGRSDATLNPGGVRIGTAEIYRQVEALECIEDSIAVGQEWDGDVRIVLFVKLRAGFELDRELEARIRGAIREGASPRHVPELILEVPDIPYTRSGKKVELAVRDAIHGRPVENREALANPEALSHFANRPELARGTRDSGRRRIG